MKKLLILILCLLCACGDKEEPNVSEEIVHTEIIEIPEKQKIPLGKGRFVDCGELSLGQRELILNYMENWYTSLAKLERQDLSELFALNAEKALAGNNAVCDYIIGLRKLSEQDMSLSNFDFKLTVKRVSEEENGSLMVLVSEDSIQNFSSLPGIDTESYNVYHLFSMKRQKNDSWLLTDHFQLDSMYRMVLGSDYFSFNTNGEALKEFFSDGAGSSLSNSEAELRYDSFEEQVKSLLIEAKIEAGSRHREEHEALEADQPYQRVAAFLYADKWVGCRNEDWPDYSPYGGNCQNFVSQCIHAGDIPMDIKEPGIWKWYGSTPNSKANGYGRSPSWSAVKDFLDYVKENEAYGLVAQADAPYYSGEIGDVIHLAAHEGDWKHTVLITKVLKNEDGETYDYLIHSNTADLKNFPVSIYPYPRQLLIKIYGWNPLTETEVKVLQ